MLETDDYRGRASIYRRRVCFIQPTCSLLVTDTSLRPSPASATVSGAECWEVYPVGGGTASVP